LDGLRAVAIVAVIVYHLNPTWAGGGYLGVDLFFVLSGFLITSLLVGEWQTSGRMGFRSFWARRARRLLPAVVVLLLVLIAYASLGGPGLDRSVLRPDALATLFYSANWHQIFAHQSYFAQFAAPSPLRHTWSLAIEEQFYLVWPLALMGLLVLGRGSRRIGLVVIGLLIAGSALLMALLYHPGVDPSRVYYGTDSRAFELLVGAALAFIRYHPRQRNRRSSPSWLHAAAIVSMGLLIYAFVAADGPPGWMYQGGLLAGTVLAAVVIASVSHPQSGPLGAVLSIGPLRWIGLVSYGLYLWHWPVLVLMTKATTGLSGFPLTAAQVTVTVGIATVSYYAIERPIRRARFPGWKGWVMVPAGVAATVTGLLVATTPATTSIAAAAGPAPGAFARPQATPGGASGRSSTAAATPTASDPMDVMIVGDSTAQLLAPGLMDLQNNFGLLVHNEAPLGCSIVRDYTAYNVPGYVVQGTSPQSCDWHTTWPAALDQYHPKAVFILFGPWDTADHLVNGHWLRVGSPEWQSYYQAQLNQMTSLLVAHGAQVVLSTVPRYHFPPNASVPDPTQDDPARVAALNRVYRAFASSNPAVHLYDLGSQATTADFSDDGTHFSRSGADRLAQLLDPELQRIGQLPPLPPPAPSPPPPTGPAGPESS
jgi:peptidoglycan/LPS O-acetylase OafA/YrhL/lysophospholipase L1-like esterase